jgi:hypothetical protein
VRFLDDAGLCSGIAALLKADDGTSPAVLVYPATHAILGALAWHWPHRCEIFAVSPQRITRHDRHATIVRADISDTRISRGSMSLAIIEIPQERAGADPLAASHLLGRAALALQERGVLAAVIPDAALTGPTWRTLTRLFTVRAAYRAAIGSSAAAVVLATPAPPSATPAPRAAGAAQAQSVPAIPQLAPLPDRGLTWDRRITVPPQSPSAPPSVTATSIAWEDAVEGARSHGAWHTPQLQAALHPPRASAIRPLMPLSRGHLGQLIACGAFDNAIIQGPEGPVLLKGRTRRVRTVLEDSDAARTTREAFRTAISLVSLRTGQITIVTEGADGNGD